MFTVYGARTHIGCVVVVGRTTPVRPSSSALPLHARIAASGKRLPTRDTSRSRAEIRVDQSGLRERADRSGQYQVGAR